MSLLRFFARVGVLVGIAALLRELLKDRLDLAEPQTRSPEERAQALADKVPPQTDGAEMTRDQLYEQAQKLDIKGRSKMSKDELQKAVASARG